MDKVIVTVIIPTLNSGKDLSECLTSIKRQTYRDMEIIIVDKRSKDETKKIAERFKVRFYQIDAKERCEQLNFAIRKARGEYVYRVDSDFILEPQLIETAVKKCEEENFDALCIHNESFGQSFWAKVRKLERDMYRNDKLNVAARFFKKKVLIKLGGFDENLIAGEDYDLHNRLLGAGYNIGYIEAKEIHVGEPKTIWEVAAKHYYYGKTLPQFVEKNGKRGVMQLSPIRPAYLKNWKKFLEDPVLTIGFITYQIVRYSAAGLGYLVTVIKTKLQIA